MGDFFGGGGDDSADAAKDAAQIQADYQREALDYLKETEALPQQFRESALKYLAGAYGLPGGEGSQQEIIDQARESPLYGAIMGGLEQSEESILRNASATGGLRSGNANDALAENAQQLENQALLTSYNQQMQGVGGLAGLPSLAPQIAAGTAGIGQTLAQGEIAAAQAKQQGNQMAGGNLMGLANLGLQAYGAFSDRRLKSSVLKIGTRGGLNWYEWVWNSAANKLGLYGKAQGPMADEVEQVMPDAVTEISGYKFVTLGGAHGV
jgi:hypothetical protein